MKLYLLLTLAFVAVQLSLADNPQGDGSTVSSILSPNLRDFYCADCTSWDVDLSIINNRVRWLCLQSIPVMQCPVTNYNYCKNFCKGAADRTRVVKDPPV